MNKLVWSADMSVGHDELDRQHQVIINLINQLIDIQNSSFDKEALRDVSSELVKYSMEHLKYEEDLLQANAYPEFNKHKLEHFSYVQKTTKNLKNALNLDESCLNEMVEFLSDWWTRHILEEDMKYKDFLLQI